MNITDINEQIERYASLVQALSKAQAQHVTSSAAIFNPMLRESVGMVKEMHEAIKGYRKDVEADINRRRKNLGEEQYLYENRLYHDRYNSLLVLSEQHKSLKELLQDERKLFNQVITDINRQLGEFTYIWGNFLEKCAAESAQKILFNEFEVLNFASKIKRTIISDVKPKRQHLEVDFLGEGKNTIYLLEVKSTLRQECFRQIIQNTTKLDIFFPHYQSYTKQPIVAYLSEEEGISEILYKSGIWLMTPKKEQDNPQTIEFELIR
jgi:hypothetical protein